MHADELILLPRPRFIRVDADRFTRGSSFDVDDYDATFVIAVASLKRFDGGNAASLPVQFVRSTTLAPQHYTLSIEPTQIKITAADASGAFYAVQTLLQLARQFPDRLPCLHIEDDPDLAVRGVMLDISRDKVPTMQTLFDLIDQLSSMKINQLQLYIEHTFAYAGHEQVWQHASPLTADEVQQLDRYCAERSVELVPNQNSFGHMERWLNHERYRPLAEAPDGADTPWGFRWKGPFSLCPTDPASLDLLRDLYAQLLPNFSSRLFNVGCDETFDIGQGRSAAEVAARSETSVYVEFLTKVNRLIESHGRRMLFWGDIIVKHPERIAELPKSAIALEWGYEADHPFEANSRAFADAGLEFYLCPGTSSWNSFAGRTQNAIDNLRSAASSAIKHGAAGYLITDWGDNGHLQYLPASYTAFAAGAAFSWCMSANDTPQLQQAIARYGFAGEPETLATAWWELGNVYCVERKPAQNGTRLFRALVPPPNDAHPEQHLSADELDELFGRLEAARRGSDENGLAAAELHNSARMMQHAVAVARRKLKLPGEQDDVVQARWQQLTAEHRRLWLARNRSGGFEDSLRRLVP